MSEITRGRTDQLGDLVAVLKLRAVDLDEGAWTAKKDFGRSLYNARLAGASRSQKQKITDRAVRHSHSRQINLIHVDDSAHGAILPNDLAQQPAFKVEDFSTSYLGIEEYFFRNIWFHHCFVPRARSFRALPGCRRNQLPLVSVQIVCQSSSCLIFLTSVP